MNTLTFLHNGNAKTIPYLHGFPLPKAGDTVISPISGRMATVVSVEVGEEVIVSLV